MSERKLVPLAPILKRLGVCREARLWLGHCLDDGSDRATPRFATFREAFHAAVAHGNVGESWISWVHAALGSAGALRPYPSRCSETCSDCAVEILCGMRCDAAQWSDAHRQNLERRLYDYAVLEGLVPAQQEAA